jgi:DNA-binding transcriptional LysR family regulator
MAALPVCLDVGHGVRCLRLEEPWAEREYVLGVLRQQRLPTVVQRFVDTLIPRDKQ